MTNRILEFSRQPVALSIRHNLLVVKLDGELVESVPCDEIAAVIVSHRQVVFTQAVLGSLAEAGAVFVSCDEKHLPAAMLLPTRAHHAQAERFRLQAALGLPTKKRLWQQIVRVKIAAQAQTLLLTRASDGGLTALIDRVRSGDPDNVEARAARRYWTLLFGPETFRRHNEDDSRNHLLDYGYAVVRAVIARAISGAGLHPTFGLAHCNAFNAFALADDLIEPFRPLVDRKVTALAGQVLSPETKRALLEIVTSRYRADDESRTLFDIATRVAMSLVGVLMKERSALWLPLLEEAEVQAQGK